MKCANDRCDKELESTLNGRRYCSQLCRVAAHDRRQGKRKTILKQEIQAHLLHNCIICKKDFTPSRRNQRTCSIPCSREFYARSTKNEGKSRRKAYDKWLTEYKRGLSCADCGFSGREHYYVLEFHHEEAKRFTISGPVAISKFKYHLDEIIAEIAKCVPVCSNCHTIRHRKMNTTYHYSSIG
jgi:hypothetical protein